MATLRETRTRISSVRNISKITQAMRMVAAAKLRRAEESIRSARPFARQLEKILFNIAKGETDFVHPFLEKRTSVNSVLLIVISSDRGLCGAFNANLMRLVGTRSALLRKDKPNVDISVVTVGKRAINSMRRTKEKILAEFPDVFNKLDYSVAVELSHIAVNAFTTGHADRIEIIHNEFVSIIRQEVKVLQLLPIEPAVVKSETTKEANIDYIFEPTRALLDAILPLYLNAQVWRTLLDSNAAEHGARMMAMDNATTNARDLIKALQLMYNRERQAAITKEMLEIVGGAEALSST